MQTQTTREKWCHKH